MAVKLALVFYCAVLVSGCRYSKNPGLIRNTFQDGDGSLVAIESPQRLISDNPAYNGISIESPFANPLYIHDSDNPNYAIGVR